MIKINKYKIHNLKGNNETLEKKTERKMSY